MSRGTRHIVWRATLLAAVLLLLACVPTMVRAAEGTTTVLAPVRIFQEYRVSASGLQSTFDYKIVPLETGAPMPADDSGNVIDTISLTRDQELVLQFPVDVQQSDSAAHSVFHYTLEPAQKELADGLHYVDILSTNLAKGVNVYYLELHVQLSSADAESALVVPTVHVEGWDGPKVTDPGWRIGYTKPEEKPDDSDDDDDDKDSGSTPRRVATSSSTGTTTGSTSLAGTGDVPNEGMLVACSAAGLALLIAGALWRRAEAGDGNA